MEASVASKHYIQPRSGWDVMSDRGNHPLVTESRKGRKGNIYYGHKEIRG